MTSIVASVTRRSITRAALLGVCVCVVRSVWAQDGEFLALQERECSIDLRLPGQMSDILSNVLMRIAKKQHAEVQAFLANAEQRYATGDDLLRAAAGRFGIDAQRLAAEVIRMKHVNCSHGEILGADGEVIEAGPPDDASDPAAPVDLSTFARNVALHVVLHELGHALVREFDLPILSNEETMADAFATHFLTTHLPDRAPDILAARVNSLLIEAGEVPRDQWPVRGEHEVEVRDGHGRASTARVSLRFRRMTVHPPVAKRTRYPALPLTVIHADERGTPADRDPVRWRLLTDLPVADLASAVEKLDWYALRWSSETYHKVLKSGCQAEQAKLRTAERLTNLLAVLCVVGWRVFWLTMMNRATPEAPAESVLTRTEIEILDRVAATPRESEQPVVNRTVSHYLVEIAKLGGYLARAKDPPPGNMVLWRGLTRLTDIHRGFELNSGVVGN